MIDPSSLFGLTGWNKALIGDIAGNTCRNVAEEKRFDHDGRLIMRSCFDRDELGRCVKESRYNEDDKLAMSVSYSAPHGYLAEETWSDPSKGYFRHVAYHYSDSGLLQDTLCQDGDGIPLRWTEFEYDTSERLALLRKTVSGSIHQRTYSISYTDSGKIGCVALIGNGQGAIAATTYHYDAQQLLTGGINTTASGETVSRLEFNYDDKSNLIRYTETGMNGKPLLSCIYITEPCTGILLPH